MYKQQKASIDIRALRLGRGWKQRETAAKLGVTRAHLSSIENGHRAISLQMMYAIIKLFGVRYDDFYSGQ